SWKSKAEVKKLKAAILARETAALQAQLIVAMNAYKDFPVAVKGVCGMVMDVIIQKQGGIFESANFIVEFDGTVEVNRKEIQHMGMDCADVDEAMASFDELDNGDEC
ncbi:unnamed protein product, partial [Cylindrotheca closterium]